MSIDRTGQTWWMNSGGARYKLLLVVESAYDASYGSSGEVILHHPSLVMIDETRPELVGTICPAVESGRLWERNPAMWRET